MAPLNPSSVALITASSAGLGAAVARIFATHNVRVVINFNSSADKANKLLEELKDLSPSSGGKNEGKGEEERYIAVQADMSQKEDVKKLVDEAVARMGRLDVVVSNHGWTRIRNFQNLDENVEEDDWDRCYNMNVKSHLWLFHAVKPWLEKTDGGFISTGSVAGVKPSGSSMAYSVTKAAQIHLIKALAVTSTIRVNTVSPGLMLTVRISLSHSLIPFLLDWGLQFPESKVESVKKKSPVGRLATVEVRLFIFLLPRISCVPREKRLSKMCLWRKEVARQIYCLAESESTTGTNVVIDGGIHLGK
ncbi:short chain dehydrogenase protein [Rutstroemia sp. NJR-2017a BBW]|nr:short chain dehydrogenase protein [Rutstroemia sp. NJR-2017a BBW]